MYVRYKRLFKQFKSNIVDCCRRLVSSSGSNAHCAVYLFFLAVMNTVWVI